MLAFCRVCLGMVVLGLFMTSANTSAGAAIAEITRISDRVFLVSDPDAKTIDYQMIVNAGCYDEAGNNCIGLAHYLEHLILIGRNGANAQTGLRFFPDAYSNGWTNSQATAFINKVPVKDGKPGPILEKLLEFYAKKLVGFEITPADAERERNVVKQEHDWRYASNPTQRFLKLAGAYEIPVHPHDQTPIGTPESIAAFKVEDAKAFHQRWYGLGNVYFVITGNIDAATLKSIFENGLKDVPPRPVPTHDWEKTAAFKNETLTIRGSDREIERTRVFMSKIFRMPDADQYGTQATQVVLGNFLASKLSGSPYSVLVERENLATDVNVALHRRAPGVYEFDISATIASEATEARLRTAMTRYTADFSTLPITETTVERLKTRFRNGWLERQNDANSVTTALVGWLARRLDPDEFAKQPERVSVVTLANVKNMQSAIASEGRVVFSILSPDAAGKNGQIPASAGKPVIDSVEVMR